MYVSYTGGDFMEFRPFVAIVPLIAVLAARAIYNSNPTMIWPIAIGLSVMSLLHAGRIYMAEGERGGIELVAQLQSRLYAPAFQLDWCRQETERSVLRREPRGRPAEYRRYPAVRASPIPGCPHSTCWA